MKRLSPSAIYRSAAFYPLTGLYLVGVAIGLLVVQGAFSFVSGLLAFSLTAITTLLAATWRELRAVHKLVDGQRDDLINRIDELAALLVESGVVVPPSGDKEKDARHDSRNRG